MKIKVSKVIPTKKEKSLKKSSPGHSFGVLELLLIHQAKISSIQKSKIFSSKSSGLQLILFSITTTI